jgi:Zn-finger nucleic acid-binding protein
MPEQMTCPQCGSAMAERQVGQVTVQQCTSCRGVFLARAELGDLVEAETDWHRDTGPVTQPLPRITTDMATPPPAPRKARAYVEQLFQ